jgi:hypothetical protein
MRLVDDLVQPADVRVVQPLEELDLAQQLLRRGRRQLRARARSA